MQTVCLVTSLVLLFLFAGTMEWYCMKYEQHKECDQPEYTGEFGKEACTHHEEVLSFQKSLKAYNRNN